MANSLDFIGNKVFSVVVVDFSTDFPVEFGLKSLFPIKSIGGLPAIPVSASRPLLLAC
jgi:hypothetical protein